MKTIITFGVSFAALALGRPAASPGIAYEDPTIGRTPAWNACAVVQASIQEAASANSTSFDYYPFVPATAAIDCLLTVPFNATDGLELLESIKPYLQWQSTLSYIKDPPEGYWREPHDILGSLQDMIDNISGYDSQYRFEMDLYMRFSLAYDGHLRYIPKLLFDIFAFGRPYTLVSASQDGIEKPLIYSYDELIKHATSGVPSSNNIVKIDDHDVNYVMDQTAKWAISNDLDAAYNQVFFNLAQAALGYMGNGAGVWAGGGRGQTLYQGEWTAIEWANGSKTSAQNYARAMASFDNITTGQDLYDRYISGRSPFTTDRLELHSEQRSSNSQPDVAVSSDRQGPPGYPQPVVSLAGNSMGGYYMNDHQEAAILSVQSFGSGWDADTLEAAITNFLKRAKADGKTRLIIDLCANGGGQIHQAYSVFKTLFPDIDPYGATRFRAFDDFEVLGQAVTKAVGSDYPWDYSYPPAPGLLLNTYLATPFIAQSDLNSEGLGFSSWSEKYGPHEYHGDNFTSIIRWNMSDAAGSTFQPNGYGNRSHVFPDRPFQAEDIIVFTDGYCASACHTFVEFMTHHAKVKTVAVGGRPGNGNDPVGPMQAVGGVRGANVYPFSLISEFVAGAPYLNVNTSSRQEAASLEALAGKYSQMPIYRGSGSINARDVIREGDEDQTPLQFVYQPADCRIFYQASHTFDMSTLWKTVYEVAWEGKRCAYGAGYEPVRSNEDDRRGEGPSDKRGSEVMPQLSNVDQLGRQWKNLVTDRHRIKDMGAFQMP